MSAVLLFITFITFFSTLSLSQAQQTYIIVLSENLFHYNAKSDHLIKSNKNQDQNTELISKHDEILSSIITKSSESYPKKLYSHTSAINAFSAVLTEAQADQISRHHDVANVYKDKKLKKTTFASYSFLGLDQTKRGAWSYTNGTNVIIGIIDDGIWPESKSFDASHFGPVPTKFKGICQTGQNFTKFHCNRKIVGARYFSKGFLADANLNSFPPNFNDYVSPRSIHGHGVHTASIAAGTPVFNAKVNDSNFGTIKGVAYSSRLSIYKACWTDSSEGEGASCLISDVVAAIDLAVKDGVDLISTSLGSSEDTSYFDDAVAKVALGALLAGVPCVFGSGNGGPNFGSVINTAPWALSVASSTLDRTFVNSIVLGNKEVYYGFSLSNKTKYSNQNFSLGMDSTNTEAELCITLNKTIVKNKIIYCQALEYSSVDFQAENVLSAGGLGMIVSRFLYDGGEQNNVQFDFFSIPTSQVNATNGMKVLNYIKNSKNPTAKIKSFRIVKGKKYIESPKMLYTSSIGPNKISKTILKPDIAAPGDHILAAWIEDKNSPEFGKTTKFNFLSGTSMACPHVSGAMALLKALHPSWPPSWLYSSLLTTATTRTNRNNPILTSDNQIASPLNYGAGHLNVNRALFPGLVYAFASPDLLLFQCMAFRTIPNFDCSRAIRQIDLNLPSLSLPSLCNTTMVKRRLTSVERRISIYSVQFFAPKGTEVNVRPSVLAFNGYNHTLEYEVTVKPTQSFDALTLDYLAFDFSYGSIVWSEKNGRSVKLTVAANVPSSC